jgi:WD40 repeat protein
MCQRHISSSDVLISFISAACLCVLREHKHSVRCVAFSPDGKRIASGSDDRTVRIWDVERQVMVGRPLLGHRGYNQESTSDTSSTTVAPGSPPRSWRAHNDEDDERIQSWANDVAKSDSEDEFASVTGRKAETHGE